MICLHPIFLLSLDLVPGIRCPINDEDHLDTGLLKEVLVSTFGTYVFQDDIEDQESYFKGKTLSLKFLNNKFDQLLIGASFNCR